MGVRKHRLSERHGVSTPLYDLHVGLHLINQSEIVINDLRRAFERIAVSNICERRLARA